MTSSAVSRQIKILEEELGVPLFARSQAGLMLTADAEALYAVLAQSFSRTAETVQAIRSGNQAVRVTLACTHAIATRWLMPRMGDFWRRFPEITVDHLISDDARDFRRSEVDLRIRYGFGAWPDEACELLMHETIYPIASPAFAARHPDCTAEDIPGLPLLHVDWVDTEWTGWDELLRRAGIPHGALSGRRFSTFGVVLQACVEDQGLAVGWDRLACDLVEAGSVVPFTDLRIASPGSYYLTWNENRALPEATRTLRDWLFEVASHKQGGYFAIIPDAIERINAGEPTLYDTWTPLWVSAVLRPGEEVEWLTVETTELPEGSEGDTTSEGIGDLGFSVDDQMVIANTDFLEENPSARRFFELIQVPIEDINAENLLVSEGENSEEEIMGHAQAWIEEHREQWDGWIADAQAASN